MKDDYLKSYTFAYNDPVKLQTDMIGEADDNPLYTLTSKVMAQVIDMADRAIVDAIVKAARENGVKYLYLIDKTFIVDAIQEKLERMGLDGLERADNRCD